MSVPDATSEDLSTRKIQIREFYNGFVPPKYVYRLVSQMLATVPTKFSNGLDCVVLTNQSGAPRRSRLGKLTSRKRRVSRDRLQGLYHPARKGEAAWIELYVDKIAASISRYPWVPVLRTACFGGVLFHEIGHHVHATVKPEFREKEDVADDWGMKLMRNYLRKHYWYVPRRAWKIIGRILKVIAAEYS